MEFLLILILSVLSTTKFVVHGAFGKRSVRNLPDAALFYTLVFLIPVLAFGYPALIAPRITWLLGGLFGLLSAAFQLAYTKALADGPVSIVGLVVNLALFLPVVFSAVAYGEPLGILRILGVFLLLCALIAVADPRGGRGGRKGWLAYAIIAMLSSGACSIVQKIHGNTASGGDAAAFVGCAYIAGAISCLVFYLACRCGGRRESYKLNAHPLLTAAVIGAILALYQVVNTYAVATVTGTFFFPAYCGLSIVLFALAGVLLFRDRLTKRSLVGVILGVLSVVLVSL